MLFNNQFASEVCPSLFQEVMQTDIERMTQMDKQRNWYFLMRLTFFGVKYLSKLLFVVDKSLIGFVFVF